jgi:multiple sugar transport system substrate-binding protein
MSLADDQIYGNHGQSEPVVDRIVSQNPSEGVITRREFIKTTGLMAGAALAGGILVTTTPKPAAPAVLKGTRLHLLQWSNFVPPADDEIRRQAAEWGKQMGVEVTIETINANDLQARIASAIESGTGPDIMQMLHNWPHLYASGCVDVDDIAEKVEKMYGGFYKQIRDVSFVDGRYKAVPYAIAGLAMTHREDWFKEVGVEKFPDNWEEYRRVGKLLKDKGHPFGQTFGHTFGDAPAFAYPYLWSFGGKEVEEDGKTVALDSQETLQAVEFVVALWKDVFDETGLSWDDTSNNRAFLSEQISCTLNGASIYFVAKKQYPELAKRINHGVMPAGPAGRFHYHVTFEHAIMSYSKNIDAAKEFILFLMDKPNFYKWFEIAEGFELAAGPDHENHPLWQKDPRMLTFKDIGKLGRAIGYPAPPTRSAAEALSKYIIVDVFARAIQGEPPKKAIEWGVSELRNIYKT